MISFSICSLAAGFVGGQGHRAEGELLAQAPRDSVSRAERQPPSRRSPASVGSERSAVSGFSISTVSPELEKSASKMMSASRIWPVSGLTRVGPMAKPALAVIQRNVL